MIYLLFGALVITVVLAGAYVSLFVGHREVGGADRSTTRLGDPHLPGAAVVAPVEAQIEAQIEAQVNAPPDTPATEHGP
jgi:hypothetical protein